MNYEELYKEILEKLGVQYHDDAIIRINELREYEFMYKDLLL